MIPFPCTNPLKEWALFSFFVQWLVFVHAGYYQTEKYFDLTGACVCVCACEGRAWAWACQGRGVLYVSRASEIRAGAHSALAHPQT